MIGTERLKEPEISSSPRPFTDACLLKLLLIKICHNYDVGAQSVGVCYGKNGNNLSADGEVVDLYKSNGYKLGLFYCRNTFLQRE